MTFTNVAQGEEVSQDISNSQLSPISLVFKASKDIERARIIIERAFGVPSGFPSGLESYQFFRIRSSDMDFADAETMKVQFSVKETWLKEKNFTEADVTLYYGNGDSWKALDTKHLGTNSDPVFESSLEGFGTFAVVAQKTPEGSGSSSSAANVTDTGLGENATGLPVTGQATGSSSALIAGIVVLIVVIAVIAYAGRSGGKKDGDNGEKDEEPEDTGEEEDSKKHKKK